jgi:hypothetical protein
MMSTQRDGMDDFFDPTPEQQNVVLVDAPAWAVYKRLFGHQSMTERTSHGGRQDELVHSLTMHRFG